MPVIEVYSTKYCFYCVRAKRLLEQKDAKYQEIAIDSDPDKRQEMIERSKRFTVPQIFIDNFHVGGFDDLAKLDRDGKLDSLLSGGNPSD